MCSGVLPKLRHVGHKIYTWFWARCAQDAPTSPKGWHPCWAAHPTKFWVHAHHLRWWGACSTASVLGIGITLGILQYWCTHISTWDVKLMSLAKYRFGLLCSSFFFFFFFYPQLHIQFRLPSLSSRSIFWTYFWEFCFW